MAETITLPAKEWKKERKKQYSPQIKYSLFTKNNKSHIKCQPYDWKVGRLIIDLLCCVFYLLCCVSYHYHYLFIYKFIINVTLLKKCNANVTEHILT